MLQDLDDLLQLWLLEPLSEHDKISSSLVPVGDLIQWTFDLVIGWRVLVRDKLLNLTSPVDNGGLKSLKEVFVFGSSLNVSEVLIWNIEECLTSGKVCGLIQECHEPMKVGNELLLDTIGPFVLLEELLGVLGSHLLQQIFEWVHTN